MPSEAAAIPAAHIGRPLSIAIAALGGQGGGVLADWIVAIAQAHGWLVQSTSVPGVAQRTGTTVYYLEICPPAAPGERQAIFALMPVPGDVDIVIAAELMEAGRAVGRGFVTPERTVLIASSHRVYSIGEKSALGDGVADANAVLSALRSEARRLICFDMDLVAANSGSVISSVLFGALAGSGVLPFPRELYERAIRDGGIAVKANLAGFAAGFQQSLQDSPLQRILPPPAPPTTAAGERLDARIRRLIPAHLQGLVVECVRRLMDYQDAGYAEDYLEQLEQVVGWDTQGDGCRHDFALTAAVARYLALWMSYEDTIRVADLKTRPQRFKRFRSEIRAAPDQIAYVSEFMHPRFEELCETLPAGLGARLLASTTAARILGPLFRRGRRIETTRLSGFLLLYVLAACRPWRRKTLRYRLERTRIGEWLTTIRAALGDYAVAVELAQCQRLVKGYGETHARGRRNFESILALANRESGNRELADRIRRLRAAALADEDGQQFSATLMEFATADASRLRSGAPQSIVETRLGVS